MKLGLRPKFLREQDWRERGKENGHDAGTEGADVGNSFAITCTFIIARFRTCVPVRCGGVIYGTVAGGWGGAGAGGGRF